VDQVMRTDIEPVTISAGLHEVQKIMHRYNTTALPVQRGGRIVGVVTLDDINRVYMMVHEA